MPHDREQAEGLVQGRYAWVYVNRGLGLIQPAMRCLCRPEVALLRLRSTTD